MSRAYCLFIYIYYVYIYCIYNSKSLDVVQSLYFGSKLLRQERTLYVPNEGMIASHQQTNGV